MTPSPPDDRRQHEITELGKIHQELAALKLAINGGVKARTPTWVWIIGVPSMLLALTGIPWAYHTQLGLPAIRESQAAQDIVTKDAIKEAVEKALASPALWAQVHEVARAEAHDAALDRSQFNRALIDNVQSQVLDLRATVTENTKLLDRTLRASPPKAAP